MSKLAVEPEEVLAVVENRDRDKYPAMSTRHVAERFDVSRRTISNRLSDLADEGKLQRLDTGVAPLYLLPDEKIAERDPDAAAADDTNDADETAEPADLATERDQYLDERDAARAEIEQLRAELDVEQELAKARADDSGGPSVALRGAWLALGLGVAAAVVGLFTFFGLAGVLQPTATWRLAGAFGVVLAQLFAAVGIGFALSEIVVQVWRHGAALDEAVGEVVRGPFGRADQ